MSLSDMMQRARERFVRGRIVAWIRTNITAVEGTSYCGRPDAEGLSGDERVCASSSSVDPIALAAELMRSPAVAMHGPEHHFLVPAARLTAFDNAKGLGERKAADLAEARRRASTVPGGFCGTHGSCGAAVGTGILWSIASGVTPLTEGSWGQSNRMTVRVLLCIADHGGPPCCKRDTFLALRTAMAELGRTVPGIQWVAATPVREHSERNRQCTGEKCPFQGQGG